MDINNLNLDYSDETLLTLTDLANYLQIAEKTLLKMIHRKEIPAMKIGNQWRFIKKVVVEWLMAKMQPVSGTTIPRGIASTSHYVPVDRLLKKELILMDVNPGTKEEILGELIQPLYDSGLVKDKDYYLSKLLQRENIVSTGLSMGIAIPHIRNVSENPPCINSIVAGVCRKGTDFNSIDGKKTHLLFLVCSDSEILHIRIIARLSRIFNNTQIIQEFISLDTKEEFLNLFIKYNHTLNFPVKEENK